VVDAQIRAAEERGEFENLPGKGKPIPGVGEPDDELWWVKGLIKREGLPTEAMLPPSLRLRKEIEGLPKRIASLRSERAVREHVAELNRQVVEWIRIPVGPQVPLRPVDVEEIVRLWTESRTPAPGEPVQPVAVPAARHRWFRRRPT
jgi:hypothetical protein